MTTGESVVLRPEGPAQLRDCLARLRRASRRLARLPLADLLGRLQDLGALWRQGGRYRDRAGPALAGTFSAPAVEAALSALAASLDARILADALGRELGRADLLDAWQADASGCGLVRGYPLGVVAQVLAGNVFLGGAAALAHGLLTRNATLLKLSREDSGFTALFARSLAEVDRGGAITDAVAVCAWDSARDEMNQVLREEADAVVVWGGEAAVAAYPADRCRGRVIHYGPRLGVGLVLDGAGPEHWRGLAWDVALWEQRACSSPRVLFVEDARGDGALPRRAARELCRALEEVRAELPPRPLSLDEKSEVLSLRELTEWTGRGEVHAPDGMSHTVVLVNGPPTEVPIGARTVLVVPLPALEQLPGLVTPYRAGLQTAVLAAPAGRWPEAADVLVRAGFTQVAAAGSAASRFLGLPHEGEFALRRLVRLVGIDLGAGPLVVPDRGHDAASSLAAALAASHDRATRTSAGA